MNSSIKSDSEHYRSSYNFFLKGLLASTRQTRVQATAMPFQQFLGRMKPLTNLQLSRTPGLRDLPRTIKKSRRQPKSTLPLKMIVSDIAYRAPLNCNSESPSIAERYPTHLIQNEKNHKTNSEDTKLFRQPLNSYLDNTQKYINENLLTISLRQHCNSFNQLYRRQYFDSEKTWSIDSHQLPIYDNDQRNSAKQTMNNVLYPTNQCSMSTPNSDQPLSERCLPDSEQEYTQKRSYFSLPDNFHPGCNNDKQNRINNHEKFVFNLVIDQTVCYKDFKEIFKDDLDVSIKGSVSEWSSYSASCTGVEPVPTMDCFMFKRTKIKKMVRFSDFESTKKKIYIPKQYIVKNEE